MSNNLIKNQLKLVNNNLTDVTNETFNIYEEYLRDILLSFLPNSIDDMTKNQKSMPKKTSKQAIAYKILINCNTVNTLNENQNDNDFQVWNTESIEEILEKLDEFRNDGNLHIYKLSNLLVNQLNNLFQNQLKLDLLSTHPRMFVENNNYYVYTNINLKRINQNKYYLDEVSNLEEHKILNHKKLKNEIEYALFAGNYYVINSNEPNYKFPALEQYLPQLKLNTETPTIKNINIKQIANTFITIHHADQVEHEYIDGLTKYKLMYLLFYAQGITLNIFNKKLFNDDILKLKNKINIEMINKKFKYNLDDVNDEILNDYHKISKNHPKINNILNSIYNELKTVSTVDLIDTVNDLTKNIKNNDNKYNTAQIKIALKDSIDGDIKDFLK